MLDGRGRRATMKKGDGCTVSPGRHGEYLNPCSDGGKARDRASCRTAMGLANGIEGVWDGNGAIRECGRALMNGQGILDWPLMGNQDGCADGQGRWEWARGHSECLGGFPEELANKKVAVLRQTAMKSMGNVMGTEAEGRRLEVGGAFLGSTEGEVQRSAEGMMSGGAPACADSRKVAHMKPGDLGRMRQEQRYRRCPDLCRLVDEP
jgi:hypothetical protein